MVLVGNCGFPGSNPRKRKKIIYFGILIRIFKFSPIFFFNKNSNKSKSVKKSQFPHQFTQPTIDHCTLHELKQNQIKTN